MPPDTPVDFRLTLQRGFSLVELMIALGLGLALSALLSVVFIGARQQSHIEGELARIQENGRYALFLLNRELSQAGFWGAVMDFSMHAPPPTAPDCGLAADWALEPGAAVDVIDDFEGSATSALGVELSCLNVRDVKTLTDIVVIKRSASEPTLRDGRYTEGAGGPDGTQWFLRVLARGGDVSWHYVEQGGLPGADTWPGSGVDYWELYANLFFIRRYSERGNDIPTLCTEPLSADSMGPVECLVEGVEDLQIEFGIDSNGDGVPDYFQPGRDAGALQQIVSARVYVLVRSLQPIHGYSDSQAYQLGSKRVPPMNDRYLRRLFSSTVWLANIAARGNG